MYQIYTYIKYISVCMGNTNQHYIITQKGDGLLLQAGMEQQLPIFKVLQLTAGPSVERSTTENATS